MPLGVYYRPCWVNVAKRQSKRRRNVGYPRRLCGKHALFRTGGKEGEGYFSLFIRAEVRAEIVPHKENNLRKAEANVF